MDVSPQFTEIIYETDEDRASAAALPNAERQRRIKTMLVRYPLFEQVVASVRRFHMPVNGGTHGRGAISGLLGSPRAGKSWAIRSYVEGLGRSVTEHADVPVGIHIDAKQGWTSLDLASALYNALNLRRRAPRMSASRALDLVEDEFESCGVQLLVVDDAHCLLGASNLKTISDTAGFITKLAERNTCNIVLAGPENVFNLVEKDPHLMGRGGFDRDTVVPYDWHDTAPEGGRDMFHYLLDDIDDRLPFRERSNLADPFLAAHFYKLSGGLVGWVKNYVEDAAYRAINDDAGKITVEHLREAAQGRRRPNDPYEPFASAVDMDDPTGALAKKAEEDLHEPPPRLVKHPRGGPPGKRKPRTKG